MTEPALLFQPPEVDPSYPPGLVEIISEVKGFTDRSVRKFIAQFVAWGYELQLTT